MAKQTKQEKAIDKRIERAYYARCNGIQINVLDIGLIFAAGRKAVAEGLDDQALGDRILAIVETLRKN